MANVAKPTIPGAGTEKGLATTAPVSGPFVLQQPEGGIPKSAGPGSNNGASGANNSTNFMANEVHITGSQRKPC